MGDFITLITTIESDGPFGEKTIESEPIYAEIRSIGMQEFYQAKGQDIKVDIKLVLYANEYQNQDKLKYNNETYRIVRTYRTGLDKIELVCARA
ncbi:hypothetical protein CS063_13740 [Sporanaerobium hydrogeniformans]|uniref:Uncharacterized protein n=1 Tax=Sporanaerobium hydrogeniformans TaxID=3072179 RepID=A0AC61DAJ1_9FIRM|nr:phage head closure protein [Sporanaerobium hydrogeniformans]PHV69775.1 hypothetical protein CS063_13740 [Sporanaerobium hydrogeniformans]